MIYAVKTLQPFSQRFMALFVCLYRNIKGLSTALFVLCHPVDLLAFNQKEKISFYMLLRNSKRWYTVITDKRLSRAKGRRNPSLFFALFCFFLAGRELKENLMWFLWGNKGWKSCTQIRMQRCSSVLLCCQGRKGKHWRSSWEKRKSPSAPWQATPEVTFRVPTHPQANTSKHSTWKFLFCEPPESLGNFPPCQFFPCSKILLLPIRSLQKTHLF